MNRAELQERLIKIAAEKLDVRGSVITLNTNKDDLLEWDSLGHTILLLGIEQEFKIRFSYDEVKNMNSIGKIVDLLEKKVSL